MSAFSFPDGVLSSFLQACDCPSYAESNGVVRASRVRDRSGQIGCIQEFAAVLFQQQSSLGENRLPVPPDEIATVQRIEQNSDTADIVYHEMKPGLATKQGVHIVSSNLRAEQRISVGAVGNPFQLVVCKGAAKGEWRATLMGV